MRRRVMRCECDNIAGPDLSLNIMIPELEIVSGTTNLLT